MITKKIALIGNPNVGKSTLFNILTHAHQHTGNWPGKTVELARGRWRSYEVVDLPGSYSLLGSSLEESVTTQEILSENYDALVVIADATCLQRNLPLLFQVLTMTPKVLFVLNLMDEAKRKKIEIDLQKLEDLLHIPVLGLSAGKKEGLDELEIGLRRIGTLPRLALFDEPGPIKDLKAAGLHLPEMLDEKNQTVQAVCAQYGMEASRLANLLKTEYHYHAKKIADAVCRYPENEDSQQRKLDRFFTGRITSWLSMAGLLVLLLWITLSLANLPGEWLGGLLFGFEDRLAIFCHSFLPDVLTDLLVHGIYRVLAWVVSVMLVPMAIFFPLFSILEDFGYLPRMAFNLDRCFQKCGSCGKQALTMCMGLGCNAVGVMGTRIIESPRDRKMALLTNAMVPCNGRFPILIQMAALFFMTDHALVEACFLVGTLTISLGMTLLAGKCLTKLLKKEPSSFIMEMPDFRRPQLKKILQESFWERTLKVLGRAVSVAAFAGFVIWVLSHVEIGEQTLLTFLASYLDPIGRFFGLDGVIILAFILGFPANEIVIPLMVMIYLGQGMMSEGISLMALKTVLVSHGWTELTALNVMIMTIFHWPCSTTCLSIKKETGRWRDVFLSIVLISSCGAILMLIVRLIFILFFN